MILSPRATLRMTSVRPNQHETYQYAMEQAMRMADETRVRRARAREYERSRRDARAAYLRDEHLYHLWRGDAPFAGRSQRMTGLDAKKLNDRMEGEFRDGRNAGKPGVRLWRWRLDVNDPAIAMRADEAAVKRTFRDQTGQTQRAAAALERGRKKRQLDVLREAASGKLDDDAWFGAAHDPTDHEDGRGRTPHGGVRPRSEALRRDAGLGDAVADMDWLARPETQPNPRRLGACVAALARRTGQRADDAAEVAMARAAVLVRRHGCTVSWDCLLWLAHRPHMARIAADLARHNRDHGQAEPWLDIPPARTSWRHLETWLSNGNINLAQSLDGFINARCLRVAGVDNKARSHMPDHGRGVARLQSQWEAVRLGWCGPDSDVTLAPVIAQAFQIGEDFPGLPDVAGPQALDNLVRQNREWLTALLPVAGRIGHAGRRVLLGHCTPTEAGCVDWLGVREPISDRWDGRYGAADTDVRDYILAVVERPGVAASVRAYGKRVLDEMGRRDTSTLVHRPPKEDAADEALPNDERAFLRAAAAKLPIARKRVELRRLTNGVPQSRLITWLIDSVKRGRVHGAELILSLVGQRDGASVLDSGTQARLWEAAGGRLGLITSLVQHGLVPDAKTVAMCAGQDAAADAIMLAHPHGAHGEALIDLVRMACWRGRPKASVVDWLGTAWRDDEGLWRVVQEHIERHNPDVVRWLLYEGCSTPELRWAALHKAVDGLECTARDNALPWFAESFPVVADVIRNTAPVTATARKPKR